MTETIFTREFHISQRSRDLYQFDETLYALNGNVIFANFHAARQFAQKMNLRRDLVSFPERAVKAGQINALGLIDEILHLMVKTYQEERQPTSFQEALSWLEGMLGEDALDGALLAFTRQFPPLAVYKRALTAEQYLQGETEGVSNRQVALEELLMLWLANENPACAPFFDLFDDSLLRKETAYKQIPTLLRAFFETQPPFGPENENLIDMLRSPALKVPHSLFGQLEFIRLRWGKLLGRYLYVLLRSLDLIREEEKPVFAMGGPGPSRVTEFGGQELELEAFSPDKDWMPHLVLIAKNTYVWLDQLSKQYRRPIFRLDQVPDEELDRLRKGGFTGLWLIGLWERSQASRNIKQMRGNPEAVASAYSLYDYQIAADLGGDSSYNDLSERLWRRGIRMSSDMVPNHMGIDSRWVIEHPDWFISLDYPPFPSYTFNGPDHSWDGRVGIFIEDHYYDNTDAAVVFKRLDRETGHVRYIYHGNDGTSMPWNDTAQLNYLLPQVREAVIQTILHVARKSPVIRFDAAMTLAKKHYQRLWFPEPGSGGDIASRSEHGLTKEQFEAAFPVEFWREVVDRVAQEVPDTLLLAEAFWLMEGYFVRTLGMHRVYNSAFMNMLRDEKNADYRLAIKNTIEFEPEILKRYVNFMNNPDERTAVDQFGKGDKYIGICTMMSTLPGLPMFGHGQIEGFTEKYGMEYRKAYWDEPIDNWLVERHEREIYPLLRRRRIFAEVENFLLYDFYTPEGYVNEDVFAYSNRSGEERSLVIYHNRFQTAHGWIRTSAAYSVKNEAGERRLEQKSLGEGLALINDENVFTIFRDHANGLEYIRNNREIFDKGIYSELEAYKYKVYLDFRQVQDNEWHQYGNLAAYLNGAGVPDVEEALKEIFLQPIHIPFRELVNAGSYQWIITNRVTRLAPAEEGTQAALEEAEAKLLRLLEEIKRLIEVETDDVQVAYEILHKLAAALYLPVIDSLAPSLLQAEYEPILQFLHLTPADPLKPTPGLKGLPEGEVSVWAPLLSYIFTHLLGEVSGKTEPAEVSRSWIDEWLLGKITAHTLIDLGLDEANAWHQVSLVKIITAYQGWWKLVDTTPASEAHLLLQKWLGDSEVQRWIGVNRYQGVLWYNKESFETLVWWFYVTAVVDILASAPVSDERTPAEEEQLVQQMAGCFKVVRRLLKAEQASDFQLDKLLEGLK
jgi:glycosidase